MQKHFEYGGYAVIARAVPSGGAFQAEVEIADAFGTTVTPSFLEELGLADTPEAAIAEAEAVAMRKIDAGEVN
jgi:hypothetical protein